MRISLGDVGSGVDRSGARSTEIMHQGIAVTFGLRNIHTAKRSRYHYLPTLALYLTS